jgi:hypothetical protein
MPDTIIPVPEASQPLPATPSLPNRTHASRLREILKKIFSFPALMGTMLVALNFAIEQSLHLDPDTWMHIKYGETILQTGHWPTGDVYSFTAHGVFRMAFEWGGEVLIAIAYHMGGLRGLDILLITLTSVIVLLIYYYAHLRSRNSKAALIGTVAGLPLAAMTFTLRPQLLGFIFLLVTLICLERYRQGLQKNLWVLPPLFLIWINTHGTWALGLFILGVYWVSGLTGFSLGGLRAERWTQKQRVHLALVFLMSVLVLPINPYGGRLVIYPINMALFQPVGVTSVQEWQPMNLGLWEGKLLVILLLAFVLVLVTLRLEYRLEELGLFLFATYATFLHVRFVILAGILIAPMVASLLARWVPPYEPAIDKHVINAALILIAIVGMTIYLPSNKDLEKEVAKAYPVKAIEYMRQHAVPGFTFNDYWFGGYLMWSLGPSHPVFIDGRADLYEETGVFSDYIRITDLKPDTLAILQAYGIRSCLIEPSSALATLLRARPEWKEVYKDNVSTLFVRGPYGEMAAAEAKR